MERDNEKQGSKRINELTERTADDVAALAHAYTGVAKDELVAAGERAVWPAAILAIGGLLAVVGVGMIVASPAVPSANRPLKRRMRGLAIGYLVAGGAGAALGMLALAGTITTALPRTRRGVQTAVDTVRDRL